MAETTADDPLARTRPASRSDGARVGAAIGLFALAIGLTAGQGWLAAAVVAGPFSGAWTASRIVPGKAVAWRVIGAALRPVSQRSSAPEPSRSGWR